MSVIVVNDMEEPKSTPWHPLNKAFPKMVECHCDLHFVVLDEVVLCTEEHNLKIGKDERFRVHLSVKIFVFMTLKVSKLPDRDESYGSWRWLSRLMLGLCQ